MPYEPNFDPTTHPSDEAARLDAKTARDAGLHLHWIKRWDPSKGVSDDQLLEIKRTLGKQWPVCAGNLWPTENAWQGDVLQNPPSRSDA